MPATVMVNARSVVHAGSTGQAIMAGPDTCKTPAAPSPVPLPYPNIALSSSTSSGSTTVTCDAQSVMLKDSEFGTSSGDEAGSAGGGVVSNVIKGKAKFTAWSSDVKFDGKEVPRLGDPMTMNGNGPNGATPAEVQPTQPVIPGMTDEEAAAWCDMMKEAQKKHDKQPSRGQQSYFREIFNQRRANLPGRLSRVRMEVSEAIPRRLSERLVCVGRHGHGVTRGTAHAGVGGTSGVVRWDGAIPPAAGGRGCSLRIENKFGPDTPTPNQIRAASRMPANAQFAEASCCGPGTTCG